jgi:NADH:ubiquinone oxidoreductase subunit K
LIYALVSPSSASIYSLVMVLLAICLFVAGVSGLMARRVIVVK